MKNPRNFESIYDVKNRKDMEHKLTNDSASIGFAVFLDKDYNGLNE
jgi:hypothetical protein